MRLSTLLALATTIFAVSCTSTQNDYPMSDAKTSSLPSLSAADHGAAPDVDKQEHITEVHGLNLSDSYFWMRLSDAQKEAEEPDAQTEDVVSYLKAENAYREGIMEPTKAFQESLFDEIVERIVKDDESVPVKDHGYWYYRRFEEGKEYAIHCRKHESLDNAEEVLVDVNVLAEGHSYFSLGGLAVSPDNSMAIFGVDTVSRREYTLHVKNLATGEMYADVIPATTGGATWANDNKTIFYTLKDPVTLRAHRIMKHVLGTDASEDVIVYQEDDETFSCGVGKTKSDRYLIIVSYATVSTEVRFLDADTPDGDWSIIQPRERDHEYSVSHFGDHFYISTNRNAKNFKLVRTPLDAPGYANWEDVIAHRTETLLEGVDLFEDYLVLSERTNGLTQLRVKRWDGTADYYLAFEDPAYVASVGANPDFDTSTLRFHYNSMTTPSSVFQMDMASQERELLKQQKVLGGKFDATNYSSERFMITARDGAQVPVSLVYKKGFEKGANRPMLLYAYGSYGYSLDPTFSSTRLSLLDRGFTFAIAHIRGGQEMGRAWYENGKMFHKRNTFWDFIDAGKSLIEAGYTSPDHLYAEGGSAGGLLMGTVMNEAPELFNGVIAAVPFVDVINTMLDETIPLTTGEFDEWGNPKNKDAFDYIMQYSPYDNVVAQDYPHLLITTGYWDSQVQYWEPAKWLAKLRDLKTDDHLMIMDCNLETGHGGASGRFKRYRETAQEFAFLFMLEGISE